MDDQSFRLGDHGRYSALNMKLHISILMLCLAVCVFASCETNTKTLPDSSVSSMGQSITLKFDLDDPTHYTPVEPFDDPGGLRIADANTTARIRDCDSINGLSIPELEELMRPGNTDERGSIEGFLGDDERLIDVMARDNDFVQSIGLTHRDLAIPLMQICQHAHEERKRLKRWKSVELNHAGILWRVDFVEFKGFQYSPFNDQTSTNMDYVLTNLESGKSIEFSGLVPMMIERYGFYEGRGTSYRVEPKKIVDVLGLLSRTAE